MSKKTEMEPVLDDLFAQARDARPVPDMDLMARILGDAAELAPVAASAVRPAMSPAVSSAQTARAPRRWWQRLDDLVPGGATGLASLTTCALAGVFIGYAGLGDLPLLAGAEFLGDSAITTFDASALGDEISYLSTEDGA